MLGALRIPVGIIFLLQAIGTILLAGFIVLAMVIWDEGTETGLTVVLGLMTTLPLSILAAAYAISALRLFGAVQMRVWVKISLALVVACNVGGGLLFAAISATSGDDRAIIPAGILTTLTGLLAWPLASPVSSAPANS